MKTYKEIIELSEAASGEFDYQRDSAGLRKFVRAHNAYEHDPYNNNFEKNQKEVYFFEPDYFTLVRPNSALEYKIRAEVILSWKKNPAYNKDDDWNVIAPKFIDGEITVRLRIGSPFNMGNSEIWEEKTITKFTAGAINTALKQVGKLASKNKEGTDNVLGYIINDRKPLSSNSKKLSHSNMGIGSHASVRIKHSFTKVIDVSDLTSSFSEEEFNRAIKGFWFRRDKKNSINYKKGLVDRSGTMTDVWD
jgi:hypothetical protein